MNTVVVWANIAFCRMDEGGLKLSFCPYDFFTGDQLQIGYPMEIDGCYYDCRLFMPPRFVELGKSYCMAIRFLSPDLALLRLSVGKRFTLWQGRTIADGIVVRMDDSGSAITRKERFESPDFYLSAVRHGDCCKPKACYLRYATCPHGGACVCGIYAQDVDSAGRVEGDRRNAHAMAIYCSSDVLGSATKLPLRAFGVKVAQCAGHDGFKVSLLDQYLLFNDVDSAISFDADLGSCADAPGGKMDMSLVQEDASKVVDESDLYGLIFGDSDGETA